MNLARHFSLVRRNPYIERREHGPWKLNLRASIQRRSLRPCVPHFLRTSNAFSKRLDILEVAAIVQDASRELKEKDDRAQIENLGVSPHIDRGGLPPLQCLIFADEIKIFGTANIAVIHKDLGRVYQWL